MTALAARAIAAEQIRYWRARGWTAEAARRALWVWGVPYRARWRDVERFMVRWLLSGSGEGRTAA